MSLRKRSGKTARRSLVLEILEGRRLQAADTGTIAGDAAFLSHDVNGDGALTPADALWVLNDIRSGHPRGPQAGPPRSDVNHDGQVTPLDALGVLQQIVRRGPGGPNRPPGDSVGVPVIESRSIDGSGNRIDDPDLGTPGQAVMRMAGAEYEDGVSSPAGASRLSAREISSRLAAQDGASITSHRDLSAFLYVWGQFIDHDFVLTNTQTDGERLDIAVPKGDAWFDPQGSGDRVIGMSRSVFDPLTGTSPDNPRQQTNAVTTWIDASMVYGSDAETAAKLRELSGGRMRVSDGDLLPLDEAGFFMAGDIRVNENPDLTAIHTLFVREHNRLAAKIAAQGPTLSDEAIYQQSRSVVIAEIQSITFNEFLPALLGDGAVAAYRGYDATIDPRIANEFAAAGYRFGHSTISDDIEFFDNSGRAIRDEVRLAEAFFNPKLIIENGIDPVLKYLASSQSQEIDLKMVDSLRNMLFGPPGSGGLDLAALNIQRGRDHGLADYNATREAYGLDRIDSFAAITSDTELQTELQSIYGSVDDIDLWIGILAEDQAQGGSTGELARKVIVDQFQRLRDGDRLWFENVYQGEQLRQLRSTRLDDVIRNNSGITNLQEDVFVMHAEASGRVVTAPPKSPLPPPPMPRGSVPGMNANGLNAQGMNMPPRDRVPAPMPIGVAGVTIELLDDQNQVIATTTTDRAGYYRFDGFSTTGDYQVRVVPGGGQTAAGPLTMPFLISKGGLSIRGLDFTIRPSVV